MLTLSKLQEDILSDECKAFIDKLHQSHEQARQACLGARVKFQQQINEGKFPNFLSDTKDMREKDWQAAAIPSEVADRRVEITGPVDRKMVINALNSGAKVFMADFEDSNAPTWHNCLAGQQNLKDAISKTIEYDDPNSGKHYQLNDTIATLMVRPRGWHLDESHYQVEGSPISASIFDAGVFLFHNAKSLLESNRLPYLYLPKLEHYQEAELWNRVLSEAEEALGLEPNCIKVTVLIETLSAVFEMDEIIYALKDRILGLNCGRWDYIFSYIKQNHQYQQCVLPNREQVTMETPFLQAYVDLLIYTCHRRGIFAMGGMAAQIPIKGDEKANQAALDKVKADKLREVKAGHDGTWVAHPGLVQLAFDIFANHMDGVNQIQFVPKKPEVTQALLLQAPEGSITEEGVRNNISVALHYLRFWLAGNGCVPVNYLMEDAATAEICRSQLWQWLNWQVKLDSSFQVDESYMQDLIEQEYLTIAQGIDGDEKTYLKKARVLLEDMVFNPEFEDFLTLKAYPLLG